VKEKGGGGGLEVKGYIKEQEGGKEEGVRVKTTSVRHTSL